MNWLIRSLSFVALLGCASGPGMGKQAASSSAKVAGHECPCKSAQAKAGQAAPTQPAAGSAPARAVDEHAAASVPVTANDPTWGNPDAPVTLVEWSDFQCPFCSRVQATFEDLKRTYGPEQLRLVWKNYPLPFHQQARPAADAAMLAFELGGNAAFWRFHDLAFENQGALSAQNYARWAAEAGVNGERFSTELSRRTHVAKVDDDLALAKRIGIMGTPVFRINGLALEGAVPVAAFKEIIDAQLAAAKELRAAGTTAHQVYPVLCAQNAPPAPAAKAAEPENQDPTVWNVPVDERDPARGPADALVTLVVFSDFECPFCKRMADTLAGLGSKYGADLRIVWKDYPMPFHERAIPAATLARLAQAMHGAAGFWKAHDALFDKQANLDDAALAATAAKLGLSWAEVEEAMARGRFRADFDATRDLAEGLQVRGTPSSFVNGVRVAGAVPQEILAAVIDSELAKARDLVKAGQSRADLYAAMAKTGKDPLELERKQVEAPTEDSPSRGSSQAEVTVQIFSDFQCPYCLRVNLTLAQLEREFPGHVRFVWRNFPLGFHEQAALAAEAAQEVFAQKGAVAFWKYHDLLFAAQSSQGLERANLERLAKKLGVNPKQFRAALDARKHKPLVERDIDIATKAGIQGTPAFVINGYFVGGARPLSVFERVVKRALADVGRSPDSAGERRP